MSRGMPRAAMAPANATSETHKVCVDITRTAHHTMREAVAFDL